MAPSPIPPPAPAILTEMLRRMGHFRTGIAPSAGPPFRKEWLHFAIVGPQLDLIVNFSVLADTRGGVGEGARVARLTMIVRTDRGWMGDIEIVPADEVSVKPGRFDARFGVSSLSMRGDEVHVFAALSRVPVAVDLRLTPLTVPFVRLNTQFGDGPLHWMLVPRLAATGQVVIAGREYQLAPALAYHDHNWGRWPWGHDFLWQWGFALPDLPADPFTLVFFRLVNRHRTRELGHGLLLWRDMHHHRFFGDGEVEIRPIGRAEVRRVEKFPKVMALLAPEKPTDVPQRLEVVARGSGDWLECTFQVEDICQILIPNETDLGVTTINEAVGRLTAEGSVRGEPVRLEGRSVFEFLTVS